MSDEIVPIATETPPQFLVCNPGRVHVFEGAVTTCDCWPSHATVGDWTRRESLADFLQDSEGKRVRVTVEVLDA